MYTLRSETFAVSRFLAFSAKVNSAKFFKIDHPRKFIPADFFTFFEFFKLFVFSNLIQAIYLETLITQLFDFLWTFLRKLNT